MCRVFSYLALSAFSKVRLQILFWNNIGIFSFFWVARGGVVTHPYFVGMPRKKALDRGKGNFPTRLVGLTPHLLQGG